MALLDELGITVHAERWQRPPDAEHHEFGELVETTRRRLCLPAARTDEVIAALHEIGVSEETAGYFGSSGQDLVTIWWSATPASAGGGH
jgi:hypothetical protein